ncbi:NADH-quinone oxidoreductase subunit N [Thermocrinis minervae]|uniref:NADH-quinone oxidoreductase subunit N n=1 Tax=Thermocrinis minervae TaxID=381751 RepID=A0A1M6TN51_9AQUI|nr:NADH-quinone oxidoreductase subunit N [Thermocrinis minervae]SHK58377.1 NADH dehydrogenase subunit N [Thermocrinis minervae]
MREQVQIEFPNLSLVVPELIVLVTAFTLFTLHLIHKRVNHALFTTVSITGYLISLLYILLNPGLSGSTFYGLYIRDPVSSLLQAVALVLTMLLLAFTYNYYKAKRSLYGEFYYILAFCLLGGMFLTSSYNLIILYVALEVVSISFYIMISLLRGDFLSKEGAFKYLILGGLSIAIASYGAGFMYLYSGSLDLRYILSHIGEDKRLLILGLVFFLFGFAIKIGAVPFHFWLPDAYQGAPTPITGYMASFGKIAFFAPLLRIMPLVQSHFENAWVYTISIIAALTMLYGNLVALVQKDVKRMLAYSSIAHSGYIMSAIAVAKVIGLKAALYFLVAYAFMGIGSFLVLTVLERLPDWQNRLEDFSGMRFWNPSVASYFAVFMFALLGVPPTVGFVGKALVFMSLSEKQLWWLAFVMILSTAISTGYYLRLVVLTFMKEGTQESILRPSLSERFLLGLLSVLVVLLGALPLLIWPYISVAAEVLFKGW